MAAARRGSCAFVGIYRKSLEQAMYSYSARPGRLTNFGFDTLSLSHGYECFLRKRNRPSQRHFSLTCLNFSTTEKLLKSVF